MGVGADAGAGTGTGSFGSGATSAPGEGRQDVQGGSVGDLGLGLGAGLAVEQERAALEHLGQGLLAAGAVALLRARRPHALADSDAITDAPRETSGAA